MAEIPLSTREVMSRYLNPQTLDAEQKDLPTVTCLVVHFHNMYAVDNPQEEAEFLRRYADIAIPIIHKFNGVIDYVASHDSTLAYFGTYKPDSEHELRAVSTAIGLRDELRRLVYIQTAANIGMGIGINTGQVFYGNVGGEERFDFGAYGTPVRLAHLIAEATHTNDILIGESTYLQVKDKVSTGNLVGITIPRDPTSTLIAHRVINLR